MEHRHLGHSGLLVSRLAYGNSTTSGDQLSDEQSARCIHAAIDLGITTFDTADAYAAGRAESALGQALFGHHRDRLVLISKVFFPTGDAPNDRGLSRKHIRAAAEDSLRRLGTDYLDIYVAHRYDTRTPLTETISAFADLARAGKILYLGVSDWPPDRIAEAAKLAEQAGVQLICSQAQYSALWRIPEAGLSQACEDLGLGQFAWSPLAGGVLTGKYRHGAPPPPRSRLAEAASAQRAMDRWYRLEPQTLARARQFAGLARAAGLDPATLALSWVLSRPGVTSVITGASRPEQIALSIRALEVTLDPDLAARIDDVLGPSIIRDPALDPQPG
jgi:aryl-alcohol dehydrogenase-like predicted oxidoreductase